MRELVRVKDPDTGHEFTTTRARAEKAGLRVLEQRGGIRQVSPHRVRRQRPLVLQMAAERVQGGLARVAVQAPPAVLQRAQAFLQ